MMVALGFLAFAVAVGILSWIFDRDRDWAPGLIAFLLIAVPTLLVWLIIAAIVSPYNKGTCERITEGYGLDNYDWSIRNGCRIELPTGQLVPEGRIRITSDGKIIAEGE